MLPAILLHIQLVFSATVEQQNFSVSAPFPVLEIGFDHIIAQVGVNATRAENDSILAEANGRHSSIVNRPLFSNFSTSSSVNKGTECGKGSPCVDGSCCNSVFGPKAK